MEGGFARRNGIVLAMWICGSGVTTPFVVLYCGQCIHFLISFDAYTGVDFLGCYVVFELCYKVYYESYEKVVHAVVWEEGRHMWLLMRYMLFKLFVKMCISCEVSCMLACVSHMAYSSVRRIS